MNLHKIFEGFMRSQLQFLQQQEKRGRPYPANHNMRKDHMSNENLPTVTTADDGFDQADVDNNRIIQGTIVRCVDGVWADGDGFDFPPETKMLALGTTTCLQRWENKVPVETIRKQGKEPLPDVDELNAQIPKEQWGVGLNNELRPPWSLQYVVYLLNTIDASVFTYINGTVGAQIAVGRLRSKVAFMRKLRGTHVVPLVKLDSKKMKTRVGDKRRPEFTILDWQQLGHVGVKDETAARIEHKPELAGLKPVEPVSLKEELNDDIPHLG